tara:strand:- start:1105 stop:1602 length:498 start_codon:yes stop_codon:yes gene_type:complete
MIKELTIEETRNYIPDDTVRAHLSGEFRTTAGRQVFALYDNIRTVYDQEPHALAVICVAYTNAAPTNEFELEWFSSASGAGAVPTNTAVFYTVWSYTKGAGQRIVNGVASNIRATRPEIKRWVTLSPLTDMAKSFHTRNGARLVSVHDTCQIFEYTHLVMDSVTA